MYLENNNDEKSNNLDSNVGNNKNNEIKIKNFPFINEDFIRKFDYKGFLSLIGENCENFFQETFEKNIKINEYCIICKKEQFYPHELMIYYNFPEFICYLKYCFLYQKKKYLINKQIFETNQKEIDEKYKEILLIPAINFSPPKILCIYCLMKYLNTSNCIKVFNYSFLKNYEHLLNKMNLRNNNSNNINILPINPFKNISHINKNCINEFIGRKNNRYENNILKKNKNEVLNEKNIPETNFFIIKKNNKIKKQNSNNNNFCNANSNNSPILNNEIIHFKKINNNCNNITNSDSKSISEIYPCHQNDIEKDFSISKTSEINEIETLNKIFNKEPIYNTINPLFEGQQIPKIFQTELNLIFQKNINLLYISITDLTYIFYLLNKERNNKFNQLDYENLYKKFYIKANQINYFLEKINLCMKKYQDNIISFEKIIIKVEKNLIKYYFPIEQFKYIKNNFKKEYEIFKENYLSFYKYQKYIISIIRKVITIFKSQKEFNKINNSKKLII